MLTLDVGCMYPRISVLPLLLLFFCRYNYRKTSNYFSKYLSLTRSPASYCRDENRNQYRIHGPRSLLFSSCRVVSSDEIGKKKKKHWRERTLFSIS